MEITALRQDAAGGFGLPAHVLDGTADLVGSGKPADDAGRGGERRQRLFLPRRCIALDQVDLFRGGLIARGFRPGVRSLA